jgi:hsp70-interacting protein
LIFQRRRFLEEALKSLTIDVVEELNKAMRILIARENSKEEQVEALDIVQDFIEDIDTANDFYKINGFCIIEPCLNSPHKEVRSGTASLIATLAQNNPFCQKHLLDLNVLSRLIELLSDEPSVVVHVIHAISCLVRNYEPALAIFIDMGGLECLLGLLENNDHEKIVIKSAFLISAMCAEFSAVRDELVKLNAVDRVVGAIQPAGEYNQKLEILLSALIALTGDNQEALEKCRNSGLGLREKLEETVRLSRGKEEECQVRAF